MYQAGEGDPEPEPGRVGQMLLPAHSYEIEAARSIAQKFNVDLAQLRPGCDELIADLQLAALKLEESLLVTQLTGLFEDDASRI